MGFPLTAYNSFFNSQLNAPIDFDAGNFKVSMVSDAYTPNAATHDFYDDVEDDELAEVTLAGIVVSNGALTANNVTFAENPSGFTNGRHLVLWNDSGTAATSPLVAFGTYSVNQSIQDGDVIVRWNDAVTAGVILRLQAAA